MPSMPKPSTSKSTAITTSDGYQGAAITGGGNVPNLTPRIRRNTMKTLMSVLMTLAVLSGSAASALADKVPPSIWEQLDREGHSHSG
jgi:hypothetical protein